MHGCLLAPIVIGLRADLRPRNRSRRRFDQIVSWWRVRLWTIVRKSASRRDTTPSQSCGAGCRYNFIVGYHGVSGRFSIQRQSGANASRAQTGKPKAPARCAIAVSTVISKSNCESTSAVCAKSVNREPISGIRPSNPDALISAAAGPTWRLISSTPGTASSGAKDISGQDRSRSR